jgi:DNA-binding transcriptional LysR family regulator
MLDTTRLRILAMLAAQGSVTAAARELGYTQPSVSRHLALLEREAGVKLLQRVGRGVRLTPAGEVLARRAVEILGRIQAAQEEVESVSGLRAGTLRVAAFQSALSELVVPAAATLHSHHPGLDLRLVDAHPRVALSLLCAGDVDVALVYSYDDEPLDDRVHHTHLGDDPLCLLSNRPDDRLADHRDSVWVAGCENCRADLVQVCESAGFTPRIAYTSDDVIVNQRLVASGLGVTTMPALALRGHHADGVFATPIPGRTRRIHLATYGEPPPPPATQAFAAAVRRHLDVLTDAGDG